MLRSAEPTSQGIQPLRGGASVVRLQQTIGYIDIHQGELRVMVAPDGSLAAISGTMRSGARADPLSVDAHRGGRAGARRALREAARPGGDHRDRRSRGYRELTVAAPRRRPMLP
jgi:hypothetical protein